MASLVSLPEELPPLRCAVDLKEKQEFLGAGDGGWLWLLEEDYKPETETDSEDEEHPYGLEDAYRGWRKVDVRNIRYS